MDNKDLFNAINDAAEELAPEVWESTEGERPVMLKAVKKPHSWIRTALASAAAVLVVGAAVAVGANIYSQRGSFLPNSSGSSGFGDIERNFAPLTDNIVRIRDVGFYSNNPNIDGIGYLPGGNMVGFMPNNGAADGFSGGGSMEGYPGIDMMEYLKEWYKDPKPREFFDSDTVVGFVPLKPDIYYINDLPLDSRMLSDEAYDWLYRYCLLSEKDRKLEAVPEYVRYLAGSGFMRYGDLGFLCDKYTEEQRKYIRECMETEPYPVYSSMRLPKPDVYYYKNVPYHLDRASTDDARNWLKWFCFLDKETQALLDGYVPEEMTGLVTVCNSEKPEEIVTYKGRSIDVRSVSYDTEVFIKWYNSLSSELQAKVGYEPEELHSGTIPGGELPVDIIGPDGERLTYDDINNYAEYIYSAPFTSNKARRLSVDDIDWWGDIHLSGFVYLAEPGSNEFKKYYVGDEICGLTITYAYTCFMRNDEEPEKQYYYGNVQFDGEISVDAIVQKFDDAGIYGSNYSAEVSGLPVIAIDDEWREQGIIVPKSDKLPDPSTLGRRDYYGSLHGENDRLCDNQGTVLHNVKLESVGMSWQAAEFYNGRYSFSAFLSYESGNSSAYDWENGGLVLPVKEYNEILSINWSPSTATDFDLDTLKSKMYFLYENEFFTKYGAEAYSVDDGEIYAIRDFDVDSDDFGRYVVVKHDEHIYTMYSHLCEDIPVKVGDKVKAGELIGYAGTSGHSVFESTMLEGGAVGYKFCVDF